MTVRGVDMGTHRGATVRGATTRAEILDRATALARVVGLDGVTIGQLATDLSLSKSGLFAHFGSKEALQIAILDHAAGLFAEQVVRPALAAAQGLPRLRASADRWLDWGLPEASGGCLFVAAAAELDDRPGPVRDRLTRHELDWLEALARIVRNGQQAGAVRRDADPDQVAFELYGILLSAHHQVRLVRDPNGEHRARRALDRLIDGLRASGG